MNQLHILGFLELTLANIDMPHVHEHREFQAVDSFGLLLAQQLG